MFKTHPTAKLYGYKMREYRDHQRILDDVRLARIPERREDNWCYPSDLAARTRVLTIKWACYEDILERELGSGSFDLTNPGESPETKRKLMALMLTRAKSLGSLS